MTTLNSLGTEGPRGERADVSSASSFRVKMIAGANDDARIVDTANILGTLLGAAGAAENVRQLLQPLADASRAVSRVGFDGYVAAAVGFQRSTSSRYADDVGVIGAPFIQLRHQARLYNPPIAGAMLSATSDASISRHATSATVRAMHRLFWFGHMLRSAPLNMVASTEAELGLAKAVWNDLIRRECAGASLLLDLCLFDVDGLDTRDYVYHYTNSLTVCFGALNPLESHDDGKTA